MPLTTYKMFSVRARIHASKILRQQFHLLGLDAQPEFAPELAPALGHPVEYGYNPLDSLLHLNQL
jgi:hypothetical protein